MKNLFPASFILFFLLSTFSCQQKSREVNEVDPKESKWINLFNGENLEGWVPKIHHHEVGDNYANTFRVKDGVIEVNYDKYGPFEERYGHLFYKESFSNFHLKSHV